MGKTGDKHGLVRANQRFLILGSLQQCAPSAVVQAYLIAPKVTAAFIVQSAIAWHGLCRVLQMPPNLSVLVPQGGPKIGGHSEISEQCLDNKATFKCSACHKVVCSTQAQQMPTAEKIFARDDLCRACMGRPKFAEISIEAAEYLSCRIIGTLDNAERPGLDSNTGHLDSLVQSQFEKHGKRRLSALVDEFSIYIYTLLVCWLCEPAADYFKLLFMINLKMHNL